MCGSKAIVWSDFTAFNKTSSWFDWYFPEHQKFHSRFPCCLLSKFKSRFFFSLFYSFSVILVIEQIFNYRIMTIVSRFPAHSTLHNASKLSTSLTRDFFLRENLKNSWMKISKKKTFYIKYIFKLRLQSMFFRFCPKNNGTSFGARDHIFL